MLNEYEKYLENQAAKAQIKERLSIDDIVYILEENNLVKAKVIKISNRSAKVQLLSGREADEIKNYPYTKLAKEGDRVVIAWETWRGNASRGGYRIERESFENLRMPVEVIPKKLFVFEEALCKSQKAYQDSFLSIAKKHPSAANALGLNGSSSSVNKMS